MVEPIFFSIPADFRNWLNKNFESERELWVGFYKKASGIPSITWSESVDEALCVGWIDGKRMSIDDKSYKIRFTPRRPKSHWSNVNIKKVGELKKLGLMKSHGLAAFSKRDKKKSGRASYEQAHVQLLELFEQKIKANTKAWDYFKNLSISFMRPSIWWVMSAKKKETRMRRLDINSSTQVVK